MSLAHDRRRCRPSIIGKTVTLKKEKKAQSKDTITHPVKNFFENW
jgi:hypothetical protein